MKGVNMGVSINPKDMVGGGGLLNDVDVVVVKSEAAMFDYGGKAKPAPCCRWQLESEGEVYDQYWSVGSNQEWKATADGKSFDSIGKAEHLSKSSNFALLMNSLVDAGYPAGKITDDVSAFTGLSCHVIRVPEPERPGLNRAKRKSADGREYENTVLIVSEIHKLPWESDAATPENTSGGQIDETGLATEVLVEVLADGKPLKKTAIATTIFKSTDPRLSDTKTKNRVMKVAISEDFLKNGPWEYDGATLKMG